MEKAVYDKYLRDLERLVNSDSGQDNPEGILEVARFFDREFKLMGWITSMTEVGAVAPCFTAMNVQADHYDFFITGHMDTDRKSVV